MEAFKIAAACVMVAVVYGVVHDQARPLVYDETHSVTSFRPLPQILVAADTILRGSSAWFVLGILERLTRTVGFLWDRLSPPAAPADSSQRRRLSTAIAQLRQM